MTCPTAKAKVAGLPTVPGTHQSHFRVDFSVCCRGNSRTLKMNTRRQETRGLFIHEAEEIAQALMGKSINLVGWGFLSEGYWPPEKLNGVSCATRCWANRQVVKKTLLIPKRMPTIHRSSRSGVIVCDRHVKGTAAYVLPQFTADPCIVRDGCKLGAVDAPLLQ